MDISNWRAVVWIAGYLVKQTMINKCRLGIKILPGLRSRTIPEASQGLRQLPNLKFVGIGHVGSD